MHKEGKNNVFHKPTHYTLFLHMPEYSTKISRKGERFPFANKKK